MFMKIPIATTIIHYGRIFYGYAGKKLFLLFGIVFISGFWEGIGLTILLPILDYGQQEAVPNIYTRYVYAFLEFTGIGISLFSLLLLLFCVFLLKGAFTFLQTVISVGITTNLIQSLRLSFFRKYMTMNYHHYTNSNIGYLNNLITVEIDRAVHGFRKYIDLIIGVIYILIYAIIASTIDWRTTVLVLIMSAALFVLLKDLSNIARKLSVLVSEKNAQIQSLLIQMIYSFKYLKATHNFTQLYKQLQQRIKKHRLYQFKNSVLSGIPTVLAEPLAVLLMSGLILYLVSFKGQAISEMLVLLVFFYRAFSRVFGFQTAWQKFWATIGGVEVLERAEVELDKNSECSGSRSMDSFKHAIVFENVNFYFGTMQILFDINLTIPKNKAIGIVGESGSGKTTLFDLIVSLLKPHSGRILIDEIDYCDLDLFSLRNQIGYVTQDPVIFSDTVANNISFWECNSQDAICRKKIEKAAMLANCDSFIKGAERDYESQIGDRGIKLSGGQRQRIAIARELFKDPEIMIFDEATSSLDTESEMLIQQSINSMMGKRTIVIIAHRLSTIKYCTYIYVLNKGRIIEEGSFKELYEKKTSRFARMCQAQNVSFKM